MRDILLAVTHFPSKRYWDDISQTAQCVELANSIKLQEEEVGHSRTVLVGDFNMNPFEDGMVIAGGLHAVMSREVATRGARTVSAKSYQFFYNPMWNLLGDVTPGPPGTYYYDNAVQKAFFWNMFDQVLVRPDLLTSFDNDDLKILTSVGETSLLSPNGRPNTRIASDHLPILFKLTL
jgi:endonuclease/exonuclease/phosphatase family metal-dependent hydrolase